RKHYVTDSGLLVVTSAEVLFQPDVETDEQVATAHLRESQTALAGTPVPPRDRDDGPREAAHDGLERQLDGQVEMGRDQGTAAVDGLPSVGLERVGDVVELDPEHHPQEEVRESIHDELEPGIVDGSPAPDESAPEDAFVALVQLRPVADDIAAVVRFVGHHDDDRVALHQFEPGDDRAPESMLSLVLDRDQHGHSLLDRGEELP